MRCPSFKACSAAADFWVWKRRKAAFFFRPPLRIKNLLPRPKDPVDPSLSRGLVYRIMCRDCDLSYVGQTGNSLETRIRQHKAGFRLFHTKKSAAAEHALKERHRIQWSEPKAASTRDSNLTTVLSWKLEKSITRWGILCWRQKTPDFGRPGNVTSLFCRQRA